MKLASHWFLYLSACQMAKNPNWKVRIRKFSNQEKIPALHEIQFEHHLIGSRERECVQECV